MFCPQKNSYLQLTCAMNPRVINKAVDKAMRKKRDPHDEDPAAQRLTSMQPALYAPWCDISRARLGFGRIGLRIINRDLHSEDHYTQLQALHSILDQVQISENAMFLINLQVVYRLIDLMHNRDPIIREKVCMTLTHLANYHQGRERIMSRPGIIEKLLLLTMRDVKEIRFASAYTLRTLARDRCSSEQMCKNESIIEGLLKMVKNDHIGIVILHLKTLRCLIEWDQEEPLRKNYFQVMLKLFEHENTGISSKAMECMTQLCKHEIGRQLADLYDLNFVLRKYLKSPSIKVVISAVGLMVYTTLTTKSKWRVKEKCASLTKRLVNFCHTPNLPLLQLKAMQVLINMADCPDIRYHLKMHWEKRIKAIVIRSHEEWNGTSEVTSYGLETGHNYRTMCIEKLETIKNDRGDNPKVVNVHSYLRVVQRAKERLIYCINYKSYK